MDYTPDEMMSIAASRALGEATACFVGIGLPSQAANLARRTHAPDLVLIYEAGAIGAKPPRLPLSIGDGILAETADAVVTVPEVFNYWVQPGRIDVGFLGAAQIDRFANINTTVIGESYSHPKIRLPGAGTYSLDSDCVGSIAFGAAGGPTFDLFMSPKGKDGWMIQTNPNTVFQGKVVQVAP